MHRMQVDPASIAYKTRPYSNTRSQRCRQLPGSLSATRDARHSVLDKLYQAGMVHSWQARASWYAVFAHKHASRRALRQMRTWQVLAKGNLRKGSKIRELYSDIRRQCVLFDDTHCVWTAGQPSERYVSMALHCKSVSLQHVPAASCLSLLRDWPRPVLSMAALYAIHHVCSCTSCSCMSCQCVACKCMSYNCAPSSSTPVKHTAFCLHAAHQQCS